VADDHPGDRFLPPDPLGKVLIGFHAGSALVWKWDGMKYDWGWVYDPTASRLRPRLGLHVRAP